MAKRKIDNPLDGYVSTTNFPQTEQTYKEQEFLRQQFILLRDGIIVFPTPLSTAVRIQAGGVSAINTTATVYTCPANNILYITSLTMSTSGDYIADPTLGASYGSLLIGGSNIILIRVNEKSQVFHEALTFPIPIKLVIGERIQVFSSDARVITYGGFTGYLIPIN